MQLTSPAFFMIFLPLALLLLLPLKGKGRSIALSALSVLWCLLAGRHNPLGLFLFAAIALFTYLIALPAPEKKPRLRLFFGIGLPFLLLLLCRLAAEYGSARFQYPYGFSFLCLGAISLIIDRVRRSAPRPRNMAEFLLFLFFFPGLIMGPMLTWQEFYDRVPHMRLSGGRFYRGVLLYMSGTVKCVAVAAVFTRHLTRLLPYVGDQTYYLLALLLPPVAFLGLCFFMTGLSDLARGVASMLGCPLPQSYGHTGIWHRPTDLFFTPLRRLRAYLEAYLLPPLARRGGKIAGPLSRSLLLILCALFLRTRLSTLLAVLPLCFLFFCPVPGKKKKLGGLWRCILLFLCLCGGMLLSLVILAPEPRVLLDMRITATAAAAYDFYYAIGAVADTRYLTIITVGLVPYLLFVLLAPRLRRRLAVDFHIYLDVVKTGLLFLLFVLTWIYLVPQFPALADLPHPTLFW